MKSRAFREVSNKNSNVSDNEIMPKENIKKFILLEPEKTKNILLKRNLSLLNEKNEKLSNNLFKMKMEQEALKTELQKVLLNIQVSSEKQLILSEQKLVEHSRFKKKVEAELRKSPMVLELEELKSVNKILHEKYLQSTAMLEMTKKHYNEIYTNVIETFRKKLYEFCHVMLQLKYHSG